MKVVPQTKKHAGFTLVEMIGVLAIIAVLAALLIPRIFAAINESRLNNAVVSLNTMKAGAASYFGKYGKFAGKGGLTGASTGWTANPTAGSPITGWDGVMLSEGFLEKPFSIRMGNSAEIDVGLAATTVTGSNEGYDLDGDGTADTGTAQYVVYAKIAGLSLEDAQDLNNRIDGTLAGASASTASGASTSSGTQDIKGRVKYNSAGNGATDVYIYLAHK